MRDKLEQILKKHRDRSIIACNEHCFCWDVDELLISIDRAAEHSVQADEFCSCDPEKQGKTTHVDGRVTCNKCSKTRR